MRTARPSRAALLVVASVFRPGAMLLLLATSAAAIGGCADDPAAVPPPPPPATLPAAVSGRPSASRPTTEPTMADLIDAARLHADSLCDDIKLAGLAGVVSADDQRYLDGAVDQHQRTMDASFAHMKVTGGEEFGYDLALLRTASESAPSRVMDEAIKGRPAIGQPVNIGFARVQMTRPVLLVHPEQIGQWLAAVQVPADRVAAVDAVARAEVARVRTVAAGLSGLDPVPAITAYAHQTHAAVRAVWDAIARQSTADQRRAFGDNMLNAEGMSVVRSSTVLLHYREQRLWAPTHVPPDALADSDTAGYLEAPADGRYTLRRADDGHVICTVRLGKGQFAGFSCSGLFDTDVQAFYSGQVVSDHYIKIDPAMHVYYWVAAAAAAPLIDPPASDVQVFSPSTEPATRP